MNYLMALTWFIGAGAGVGIIMYFLPKAIKEKIKRFHDYE